MKGISKNKSGISLIVLVITIIVMIILASAIILSLRSSGIIGRANEAKTKSDIANAKEVVSLAYAEWELDNANLKGTYSDFSAYATAKLAEAGFDTDNMYVTEDGELYTGVAAFFTKNNIAIGTEVTGYTLNDTASYTTDGNENTYDEVNWIEGAPQPATITRDENITWSYFGIDESGEALLLGSVTSTSSKLTLGGKGGYLNGPSALNTICDKMYTSDMGVARSINYDDVISILQYTGPKGWYGYYDDNADDGYVEVYTKDALTIAEIQSKLNRTFSIQNAPDGGDGSNYKSEISMISKTDSNIKAGEEVKNLIFKTPEYWLASTSYCFSDEEPHYFNIRSINNSVLDSEVIFATDDSQSNSVVCAIRPIVELATDVKASYNGTTVTLSK